jgi:putative membrane protein
MMGGYGMMAGLGWLGMLVMAMFWIGVIMLIVWGLSNVLAARQARPSIDPGEILKERFARGEISPEEYTQAWEVLSH